MRMFEEWKDKAKKAMGKMENHVDEITSLLTEAITPKINTLCKGKSMHQARVNWLCITCMGMDCGK